MTKYITTHYELERLKSIVGQRDKALLLVLFTSSLTLSLLATAIVSSLKLPFALIIILVMLTIGTLASIIYYIHLEQLVDYKMTEIKSNPSEG